LNNVASAKMTLLFFFQCDPGPIEDTIPSVRENTAIQIQTANTAGKAGKLILHKQKKTKKNSLIVVGLGEN
jgi:hypothetical protein